MSETAKWYVVHTYSGYENKVAQNIEKVVENHKLHDLIEEIKVPTETVVEVKDDGSKKEVERKIFPGYVLVKMILTDDSWYVVRNIRGVTGFVGSGNKPLPLSETDFASIFDAAPQVSMDIRVGDNVRILSGLFENFSGKVTAIDEETQKISVTVPMLKRETAVELNYDEVIRED